jgi:hypothetical protein
MADPAGLIELLLSRSPVVLSCLLLLFSKKEDSSSQESRSPAWSCFRAAVPAFELAILRAIIHQEAATQKGQKKRA